MKVSPKRRKRGSILIIASLFTFLTLLAAFTLFKVLPMEFNAAKKARVDLTAHYTLDAGLKDALAWIELQPPNVFLTDDQLAEYNSTFGSRGEFTSDWENEVRIERIERGHYGIVSTAYFRDQKVREARAQVVREGFERYALFIDHWRYEDNPTSDLVYVMGENLITGPFHTNDHFVLMHPDTGGFGATTGLDPFVSGPYAEMTHAGLSDLQGPDLDGFELDGNVYTNNGTSFNTATSAVPFDENGALDDRYGRVVEGGKGSLSVVEPIDFPNTAVDEGGVSLREKARGGDSFSGTLELGVYVPKDGSSHEIKGGVYVVGDAELELALDSNGNQIQRFEQQHLEEVFFETEEVQQTRPRYVEQQTNTPPAFVEQVNYQDVTRNVIVDYSEPTVSVGDGITTSVRTPIYGSETVSVPVVTSVPYDPAQHGTGPWTTYVEDVGNPIVYTTTIMNPIDEADYDPDNPNHVQQFQPAGDRLYEVVEVTEDAGFQIPGGFTVEGAVGGSSVPKDHTVLLDHEEGKAIVSAGNSNGITFVDGNIERLSGVNKGSVTDGPAGHTYTGRTIVAAPEFNKSIEITNHIRQFFDDGGAQQGPDKTLKEGELPPNARHALGLIAHSVDIKPSFSTSDTNPINIYAVVLAGHGKVNENGEPILDANGRQIVTGGFGVDPSLLEPSGPPKGRFRLYGGIIEGNAREWFAGDRGLEGNLIFDPAAGANLNNFPTTKILRVVRYSEYPKYD